MRTDSAVLQDFIIFVFVYNSQMTPGNYALMLITGIIVNVIIMITIIIAAIFPCLGALIAPLFLLYVSASVTAPVLIERHATLVGEVYSDRAREATHPSGALPMCAL